MTQSQQRTTEQIMAAAVLYATGLRNSRSNASPVVSKREAERAAVVRAYFPAHRGLASQEVERTRSMEDQHVWFSRESRKLYGEFEVGETLRRYLQGEIEPDSTEATKIIRWHRGERGVRPELLSNTERALCHKLAEGFITWREIHEIKAADAASILDGIRAEIVGALSGWEREFVADDESLDSRRRRPRDPFPEGDRSYLFGDSDPSGMEGSDWADRAVYGSVGFKVKGRIDEVRLGISGTLHPFSKRGKSRSVTLAVAFRDFVQHCKAGVKAGTNREEVARFYRQHVVRMVAGWIGTADPFERAEMFARYADIRRTGKRVKFEVVLSYGGKDENEGKEGAPRKVVGGGELAPLAKELCRQLDVMAARHYAEHSDLDLHHFLPGEEIERKLYAHLRELARDGERYTEV